MASTGDTRRVAIVGATGNVGTSVMGALRQDPDVEITAMSRRQPPPLGTDVRWERTDICQDDLVGRFADVDTVVHLAWLFQPTHDPVTTWRNNALGSIRVFEAAAAAGVRSVVYASSIGAYSPGRGRQPVNESWPTHGYPTSAYSREKAYLERYLDAFERRHPDIRVVRMRMAFCFKPQSAEEQRRLFIGPFLPNRLARPELLSAFPLPAGLRFQAVHSEDVGEAYRLAVRSELSGAFNIAAEPLIDASVLGELLGARPVPVPPRLVRGALSAAWHLHLVPASPQLFDTFMRLPVMDTSRAQVELAWNPKRSSTTAIAEFLLGLRAATGHDTPPLQSPIPGGRLQELRTGVGERP
ncbi:NAD-dependent epimerase/dehydratase family protein [Saccharopolyspora rhizosphaerae]|uniref:NAD-dependent epimerase/dehydratase family protein n=1 Tax=Saccharopolyspora rhizosphaerae TaxID=2492662 RepID=A0A426JLW1_9PSEU|nr:NAD-dependent epimerase/dehydratase family protein [Saccharopolyspora rhizosphaerae]RRO14198.1 NAD-dependent epimerase/dehydratase family protein [Saccharopolyspora rhizosphaerae]